MPQNRFYRICLGIIFILLIIYLLSLDRFIFRPITMLLDIFMLPMMLSFFLYYLLRPIVNVLERRGVGRGWAVLLIYLTFAGLIALFIYLVWPTLREQIQMFINNAPKLMEKIGDAIGNVQSQSGIVSDYLPDETSLRAKLAEFAQQGVEWASNSLSALMGFISSFTIVIATVPIILFYMLKEGAKFGPKLLVVVPAKYRADGKAALEEIDDAVGSFIVTRVVVNLMLGVMMYIGFLIIGLDYALLLTIISIVLNFIPYIGALLAAIPVVIIAYIDSPMMALWSVIIIIVAQQIQDNFLSPLLYGKRLDIHPVTVIVLLLLGGEMAGILGMLLCIPLYMIGKILSIHVYRLFFRHRTNTKIE